MTESIQKRFPGYKAIAEDMTDLWRWFSYDKDGNVSKANHLMTQTELLNSLPEINPRFFHNFDVDELVIRQKKSGATVVIKRAR
jgi:hypothetical protein